MARRLIPGGRGDLWAMVQGIRLLNHLPTGLTKAASKLSARSVRLHDSFALKDYTRYEVASGQHPL